MSTKQIPFTQHSQVVDYVNKCYCQNLNMQNHIVWVNNKLMMEYMSSSKKLIIFQ